MNVAERIFALRSLMKEKGIDQYLEAAMKVKKSCPATQFHVCGFCEPEYEDWMKRAGSCEVAEYHGMIRDVAGFMKEMHCIVHPTYYPEGLSNVLLEACACGRPVITTDRAGCREAVRDGINGYLVPEKNAECYFSHFASVLFSDCKRPCIRFFSCAKDNGYCRAYIDSDAAYCESGCEL